MRPSKALKTQGLFRRPECGSLKQLLSHILMAWLRAVFRRENVLQDIDAEFRALAHNFNCIQDVGTLFAFSTT